MPEKQDISQDPEALGFNCNEWKPDKTIVAKTPDFTVLTSRPSTGHGTIQLSIRRQSYNDDILRLDSYREGYFSAFWHSNIPLGKFLTLSEAFLERFKPVPNKQPTAEQRDERYNLDIHMRGQEPLEYYFDRPLTEEDIEREHIFSAATRSQLLLLRINTPIADFFHEPQLKRAAVMATIDPSNKDSIILAAVEFITATQPVLTDAIVTDTFNRIPYLKSPEPVLVA